MVLVRLTYFRELMEGEFGAVRAASLSRDHVFAQLGGRTVEEALEAGIDPREAWLAVCEEYDLPPARRLASLHHWATQSTRRACRWL